MSVEQPGAPLNQPYVLPGGEARPYLGELTIDGAGAAVVVSFEFPMIGRPSIVSGDPIVSPRLDPDAVNSGLATGPPSN